MNNGDLSFSQRGFAHEEQQQHEDLDLQQREWSVELHAPEEGCCPWSRFRGADHPLSILLRNLQRDPRLHHSSGSSLEGDGGGSPRSLRHQGRTRVSLRDNSGSSVERFASTMHAVARGDVMQSVAISTRTPLRPRSARRFLPEWLQRAGSSASGRANGNRRDEQEMGEQQSSPRRRLGNGQRSSATLSSGENNNSCSSLKK